MSWTLLAVAAGVCAVQGAPALGADGSGERPRLEGGGVGAGVAFYRPHMWGVVETWVWNPTDEDLDLRVIFRFSERPQRQFVREVWVPARSRRKVEAAVRYSGPVPEDTFTEAETILTRADAEVEYDRRTRRVRVADMPRPFLVITGRSQAEGEASIAVMGRIRERLGLTRTMSYLTSEDVMRLGTGWESVEVAALVTAEPGFDAGQREAVRRWVEGGGTLVVFADLVANEQMVRLLGESWGVIEVDRVTLSSVRFEVGPDAPAALESVDPSARGGTGDLEFERPVGMRRVVAPEAFETWLEVRGWPALLTRRVGHGRVVVATMGAAAWRAEGAEAALGKLAEAIGAEAEGGSLAARRSLAALAGESGQRFVTDRVGYQIAPRAVVAAVLVVFLGALVGGALLWSRRGRLELMGPMGMVAAVLAVAVLLVMGQRERRQIEPTRASLQMVRALPGEWTAPVRGVMGLYDSGGRSVMLSGREGGTAWPISTAHTERQLSRLHLTDLERWHWSNLRLASGAVQVADFTGSARLERPIEMSLRYGEQGLSGRVDWPVEGVEDAMVATWTGNLEVGLSVSGSSSELVIRPQDVLPRGVYYARGVLGQAQQERGAVLGALLGEGGPSEPTLLAWSGGLGVGIETDLPLGLDEQALWQVPLRVERSEPGSHVRVPWPLIEMHPLRDPEQSLGLAIMPIYSASERRFQADVSLPAVFLARFVVPEQVLPLRVEEAVVHLDITAMGRPVDILAIKEGRAERAATLHAPDGPQAVTIPAELLEVDEAGGVLLAFEVGRPASGGAPGDARSSQMWTARHFGLEVGGTVLEGEAGPAAR